MKKQEKTYELEKQLCELIQQDMFGNELVEEAILLLSIINYGEKATTKMFGRQKFISNLKKNGGMSKEGLIYISEEDEKYSDIWFILTLFVGQGLMKRTNE